MSFAEEMLEEAIDYNLDNVSAGDQDDDLIALENDLRTAMQNDTVDVLPLAREVRRYLIANGYTDSDEIAEEN